MEAANVSGRSTLARPHLVSLVKQAAPGPAPQQHIESDCPTVFAHACKMGLEGIVSKRKSSPYRSGRSPDWLKSKNPACEAVQREPIAKNLRKPRVPPKAAYRLAAEPR